MSRLFDAANATHRQLEEANARLAEENIGLRRILAEIVDDNGGTMRVEPKVRGLDLDLYITAERGWAYTLRASER